MTAILNALFRLLLPLLREWWKKQNWSAHSIKHLKEIHYIFFMYLLQFALFLYVIDHGLGIHIYYSEKLKVAELDSARIEQLTARNHSLEEQVHASNQLLRDLVNSGFGPTKPIPPAPSGPQQVEGFKQRHKEH